MDGIAFGNSHKRYAGFRHNQEGSKSLEKEVLITVAIPCYRSKNTLPAVVDEIRNTINARPGYDYQIVLVNDCSPDDTLDVIRDMCQEDRKIIGIDLSRNKGQANARMAAFDYIDGDYAVFMDDDGQHPACEMFRLIEKLEEGYDLVTGYFPHVENSLMKKITSRISTYIFESTGKRPKGAVSSSYFAINRLMIDNLKEYRCPFPSVFGYLYQITNRIAKVELEHRKRAGGSSGYTFGKRLQLFIRSMVNFSLAPLQLAYKLAMVCGALGGVTFVVSLLWFLIWGLDTVGLWMLASLMLVLTAVVLAMMGLMGEYLGRAYLILSEQPRFIIREVINSPKR